MEMMEIVLLAAGGIIFILSFFIPDRKNVSGNGGSAEELKALAQGELQGLVSQEMNSIRTHVDDVVEEAVTYAMEKTERSLERLSNEKIMAVNEYSDTVLAEIHKNHEEAMFLYDMLNNKHIALKNTVSEVNRTVKEAEEAVGNFQKLVPETLSVSEARILDRAAELALQREPGRFVQENSGAERPGTGRPGAEQARTGKFETEKTGTERFGSEQNGTESPMTDIPGLGSPGEAGPVNSGLQYAGVDDSTAVKDKAGDGAPGTPLGSVSSGNTGFMQDMDGQMRNNNEKILALFQQGRSPVAIARELGLGVGEVKLVIDLFKDQ